VKRWIPLLLLFILLVQFQAEGQAPAGSVLVEGINWSDLSFPSKLNNFQLGSTAYRNELTQLPWATGEYLVWLQESNENFEGEGMLKALFRDKADFRYSRMYVVDYRETVLSVTMPVEIPGGFAFAYSAWNNTDSKVDAYLALVYYSGTANVVNVTWGSDGEYVLDLAVQGDYAFVAYYTSYGNDYYYTVVSLNTLSVVGSYGIWYDFGSYAQLRMAAGTNYVLAAFTVEDTTNGDSEIRYAILSTSGRVAYGWIYYSSVYDEFLGLNIAYDSSASKFIVPFVGSAPYVGYAVVDDSDSPSVLYQGYPGVGGSGVKGHSPSASVGPSGAFIAWVDETNDDVVITTIDSYASVSYSNHVVYSSSGDLEQLRLYAPLGSSAISLALVEFDGSNYLLRLVDYDIGTWTQTATLDIDSSQYPIIPLAAFHDSSTQVEYFVPYVVQREVSGEYHDRILMVYTDLEDVSTRLYLMPDDKSTLRNDLLSDIEAASDRIHAAIAFFEDTEIADYLVQAHNRGVEVQVVVDDDSADSQAVQNMIAAGITVVTDESYEQTYDSIHIMHSKFLVIDNIVYVGSMNFDVGSFDNYEVVMRFESEALSYVFENAFSDYINGDFGTQDPDDDSGLAFIHSTTTDENLLMQVYFGPSHYACYDSYQLWEAGKLIKSVYSMLKDDDVSTHLYTGQYIFSTASVVMDVLEWMTSMEPSGEFHAVFNEILNADSSYKALYYFWEHISRDEWLDGDPPVVLFRGGPEGVKVHMKLWALYGDQDFSYVAFGSMNPTKSANLNHTETLVIINSAQYAQRVKDFISNLHSSLKGTSWRPVHPVINEVLYYSSSGVQGEWVEILNPTNETIDLSNYLIGDSENPMGDDEGMYRFPSGSSIGPYSYAVIAYDASTFETIYGFKPDFEIAGTDPEVPDLTPYDTSLFTGSWNLDDSGDEVLLCHVLPGSTFIKVVDAVWYGSSSYNPDPAPSASQDRSIRRVSPGEDSYVPALVFTVKDPTPGYDPSLADAVAVPALLIILVVAVVVAKTKIS